MQLRHPKKKLKKCHVPFGTTAEGSRRGMGVPRREMTAKQKKRMWSLFDENISGGGGAPSHEETCDPDAILRHREGICSSCHSLLRMSQEGFPTCSSVSCGKVFRDVLDCSPEWKTFPGNDDKSSSADMTRCGNPANPLLSEFSFGCRLMSFSGTGGGCGGGGGGGGGAGTSNGASGGAGSWSSRSGGNGGASANAYDIRKFKRYTDWQSMPHREKSLYNEFQFINIMAQNAGIPRIFIDDAMRYHKDLSAQKMFRGLNRDGMKAASIYISCRVNGHPRCAHEIADIFHLDKTSATNGCSAAVNLLHNIKRNVSADTTAATAALFQEISSATTTATTTTTTTTTMETETSSLMTQKQSERPSRPPPIVTVLTKEDVMAMDLCVSSPSTFIERFCSKLNLPFDLAAYCKFVAQKIERQKLLPDDNTPQSLAAGIIFFVARMHAMPLTNKDIRRVCNVSEVTINKCAAKVETIRAKIVPSAMLSSAHSNRK